MFIRTQTNGDRTYLLLVENERVDGRIKQRVLHRLGRLDELRASGELDRLLTSLGRFSEKYAVLGAHANGESLTTRTQTIGPSLIFERLWQETGIAEVVRIGNRGYRRFVKTRGERFAIDEQKIRDEARFDGKWVLTTNTELSAKELALKYKQLWMVEAIFRTMKSQLATRPIFHKCDDTIRGHVFCSFLALLLRKELEQRLEQRGWSLEWADVIRDLDRLQEIEIHLDGKRYLLRTETKGTTGKVFQACGVALPPTLRTC